MPLINGLKMACEPCIRGHRSTKCTHANERLMVPVRKPGRPLSSCPHPASRPCSCGQVTAAIPRKQKCHCGPSTAESPTVKAEDGDSSKVTDSSKSTTPQSPSKAINASFRVQKTATKNGAQSSSRRQSVDPVALERMDPNMLNIMPPYAGVPQKPPIPMPDASAFGAMGMIAADTPYGPMVYPMFPPHMPPHMMAPDGANGITNGHSSTLTNGHAPVEKPEKPTLKIASCCGGGGGGGGTNGVATITPTTQSPTVVSSPLVQSDKKTKSCCSSGIDSPKTDAKADGTSASDATPPNGLIMPPFQAPMVMPNGMYPYYPQPTIFTYPPQYGSYLQPLQPEQWRQVMASMTFAAVPGAMPSPYGMPGAVPYQPQGQPHSATSSSHSAVGTSHQCTCGEGCQCVGCAAHPYNEATQNYVRSAWESMLDEPQSAGGHVHGDRGHTRINGHGRNGSTANESSNAEAIPGVGPGEGTKSPPAPQTPSDAASGMSDEQALSANDFFFVSYPFGDSVSNKNIDLFMDRRQSFSQRSPRREHRSREWSDRGSYDRDSRRRDSRSRSRSRSPKRAKTSSSRHDRHTEESSRRHKSSRHRPSHRHREHASRAADARTSVGLPFEARALSKLDLDAFEPLFANYLSIQKQKEIEDMDDREVRGRWKSFVGKWNRGELAEGWYDPEMFARVTGADSDNPRRTYLKAKDDVQQHDVSDVAEERRDGSEEEDDDYGPVLPSRDPNRRAGPGIPTMTDLSLRNEQAEEDKQANMADLRELRKADRALQKERLDELVPRADAGTHERKMEKRQLVNDKMRSFRDKSPGMDAADDREVMGGGDSLEEYKRAKQNEQRRKTEREIRREEVDRAKREEMEERRKAWREREDGTMGMLKELARQRFG